MISGRRAGPVSIRGLLRIALIALSILSFIGVIALRQGAGRAATQSVLAAAPDPIIIQKRIDATSPTAEHFPKTLSSRVPYDVDVKAVRQLDKAGRIEDAQRLFDITAWQAFIALNWPVDSSGKPALTDADPGNNTVHEWEYWINAVDVFRDGGAPPREWDAYNFDAAHHPVLAINRKKAAWRQSTTRIDENKQAFSGPMVDQNGKWVQYSVFLNRVEYDYIKGNTLYSQAGQERFSKDYDHEHVVDFPRNKGIGTYGAIEIKLAWKQIGNGDVKERFLIKNAEVLNPDTGKFEMKEMGLVGMHISMRTESSPTWIWSTFEQIDNVRVKAGTGGPAHPTFFNPQSTTPVNMLNPMNAVIDPKTGLPTTNFDPKKESASTWLASATTTPTQTTRVLPLDQPTEDLNAEVQAILKGAKSVLQYYELIGTQWPVNPGAPAFAGGNASAPESIVHKTPGNVVPVFLTNSTMETFFQKGAQPAGALEQDDRLASDAPPIDSTVVFGTESCVGCHYSAGIVIGFRNDPQTGKRTPIYGENTHFGQTGSANFSWLLQLEAK